MVGYTNGRKIKHFLKNLNFHKKKTGNKNEKAIDGYIFLLKKEEKEGTTKWIVNAKNKAQLKLKKYGIPMSKIQETLNQRGLENLSSKIV